MTKWRGLYDRLMPDRHVMLINSQVGCCVGGSGGCNAKTFGASLPEWCYETSTTMYQPADGDDMWDVVIERHNSIKGRGHLARPGKHQCAQRKRHIFNSLRTRYRTKWC